MDTILPMVIKDLKEKVVHAPDHLLAGFQYEHLTTAQHVMCFDDNIINIAKETIKKSGQVAGDGYNTIFSGSFPSNNVIIELEMGFCSFFKLDVKDIPIEIIEDLTETPDDHTFYMISMGIIGNKIPSLICGAGIMIAGSGLDSFYQTDRFDNFKNHLADVCAFSKSDVVGEISSILCMADTILEMLSEPSVVRLDKAPRTERRRHEKAMKRLGVKAPRSMQTIRWTMPHERSPNYKVPESQRKLPLHYCRSHWRHMGDRQTPSGVERAGHDGWWVWIKGYWRGNPDIGVQTKKAIEMGQS